MAKVKNTISLQDQMSPVLKSLIGSMQSTIDAMAGMDKVSDKAFQNMQNEVQKASEALGNLGRDTEQLPPEIQRAESAFERWQTAIITANQALDLTKRVVGGIGDMLAKTTDITDQQLRLRDTLSAGEDLYDIQEKIKASAADTGDSYAATMKSAIQMKQAMQEFGVTTEGAIRMAEILNKGLVVGGTSSSDAASLVENLQKGMATGKVRERDWRMVELQSSHLAEVVAENMGYTRRELYDMVKAGEVSSVQFADALLAAGENIDQEYAKLPNRFTSLVDGVTAFAEGEFVKKGGLHDKIIELLSNETFLNLFDLMKSGIETLFDILTNVLDVIIQVSNWFADNWTIIEPIIWGLAAAIGVYAGAMGISAAMTWLATGAAQAFFVTLLTNPLTYIALAIGVIIGAIYAWVQSVGGLENAWAIVTASLDVGLKAMKLAFFSAIDFILSLLDKLKIAWKTITVTIDNFIGDMKSSVLLGLQDMINGAIGLLNDFINTLNRIPGVSIEAVDTVSFGTAAQLENEAEKRAREQDLQDYKDLVAEAAKVRTAELDAMKTDVIDAAFEVDRVYAQGLADAEAKANKEAEEDHKIKGDDRYRAGLRGLTLDGGELDSIGKIKDDVSITDEDVKLLKDIAKVEYVNQYTTLKPEMNVSFGDVRETADVNSLLSALEDVVEKAYSHRMVG